MKLSVYPVLIQEAAGLTANELAALYNCHWSAVYQRAREQGWRYVSARVRKLPPAEERRALVAAEPDLTAADLMARYRVTAATVSIRCKAAGIKLRRAPYGRRQERRS